MPPGHMAAKSIFFLAVVVIVAVFASKVDAFYVVPHIVPNKSLLPADGKFEVRVPVLEHRLLHVLVKHLSCTRRPWKIK